MSNLTGTPSVGKVELIIDATNARRALDDFDLELLARSLGVSVCRIKSALLTTTMDRTIVEFTSGFLKFKPAEKKKLEQKGKTVLEPYKSLRESVVNLLWPRGGRECRTLIDMAIMPAVVEAQKHQTTSPITITSNTSSRQTESAERLLIVQDYQIPTVENGETFHGLIDYVILLVPEDSYSVIRSGIVPLASTQGSSLLAIVEAKSPIDWEAARARLAAQCIAMLKSTGREYFPAVLTSGIVWFFYLAVAHDDGITLYGSEVVGWTLSDESDGLIIGTLIELLENPCTLPPAFELKSRRS
ncbi:hypothetical protein B0H13DRAFT_1983573 [Mycena leptocephala]|nr:hypothetical protein B0H13DRAFT_1983573 [Mycena leptocephala]